MQIPLNSSESVLQYAADACLGFTSLNPERQLLSDFTTPYIETGYSIYVSKALLKGSESNSGVASAILKKGVLHIAAIIAITIGIASLG